MPNVFLYMNHRNSRTYKKQGFEPKKLQLMVIVVVSFICTEEAADAQKLMIKHSHHHAPTLRNLFCSGNLVDPPFSGLCCLCPSCPCWPLALSETWLDQGWQQLMQEQQHWHCQEELHLEQPCLCLCSCSCCCQPALLPCACRQPTIIVAMQTTDQCSTKQMTVQPSNAKLPAQHCDSSLTDQAQQDV